MAGRKKNTNPLTPMRDAIDKASEAADEAKKAAAVANAPAAAKEKATSTAKHLAELKAKYKREAFKILAVAKAGKAIKALKNLKALANRSTYTFSKDDTDQISEHLRQSVNAVISEFESALEDNVTEEPAATIFNFK